MRDSKTLYITLALLLAMGVSIANAEDLPPNTMTPQEYEAYREQMHRQIEQANPSPQSEVAKPMGEQTSAIPADDKARGGYGQGYRARAERNASRMDSRGASHRGGGHGR
jgi:hypothetical protein